MDRDRLLGWILRSVGILIFIFIITRIDVGKVIDIYRESDILLILLLVLVIVVYLDLVRAYRWTVLLRSQDIAIGFWELFSILFTTSFVSNFLPGRLGEIVRIFYVNKKGHSFGKSSVSVFVDRIEDTIVLLVIGLLAIFVYSSAFIGRAWLMVVVVMAFIGALFTLLLSEKVRTFSFRMLFLVFLPRRIKEKVNRHLDVFFDDMRKIRLRTLGYTLFLSLFSWLVSFVLFYFIADIMSIGISLVDVILISSIGSIIVMIPISFSGIGTRDAMIILIFSRLGLSVEKAVAFSSIMLLTNIVFSTIGFFTWQKNPLGLKLGNKNLR